MPGNSIVFFYEYKNIFLRARRSCWSPGSVYFSNTIKIMMLRERVSVQLSGLLYRGYFIFFTGNLK